MFDPEALEAAKKFLFGQQLGPQPKSMPSTLSLKRRSCSVDSVDEALMFWPGIVNMPCDMTPRLVKRQQPARL